MLIETSFVSLNRDNLCSENDNLMHSLKEIYYKRRDHANQGSPRSLTTLQSYSNKDSFAIFAQTPSRRSLIRHTDKPSSKSCYIKLNYDCNNDFLIDLATNRIPFGTKTIGKK